MNEAWRIGMDENGLGSRLGPMVVTAVAARVTPSGARLLGRALPTPLRADLDDSKRLVSHADVRLAEAWARVLAGPAEDPAELFERLSLEGMDALQAPCPAHVRDQCWCTDGERFAAGADLLVRLTGHVRLLAERGITLVTARSSVVCTQRLNRGRRAGHSRFTLDLHSMEALALALRDMAGDDVLAICGKVGGIRDYGRFFGPLGGRLRTILREERSCSAYRFPGLGELRFVADADSQDALVMLASLIGKYVRELLMGRVARHYASSWDEAAEPSGYHDPRTARFVERSASRRVRLRVPDECFERTGPRKP